VEANDSVRARRTVVRRIDVPIVLVGDDFQGRLVRWTILHHLVDSGIQRDHGVAVDPLGIDIVGLREQHVVDVAVDIAGVRAFVDRRVDAKLLEERLC